MPNIVDGSDPRRGEVDPRSDRAKRFRAAALESWDDDFVFRPAEPSLSSRSSASSLPCDFSPTSTSTNPRRLCDDPTDVITVNGCERQSSLSLPPIARRRESASSLASSDWTASHDLDATITPSRREGSELATDVHVVPSSSKTRRLQPCSSPKLAFSTPVTTPTPGPASADAEARQSTTPKLTVDSSISLTTREDGLAVKSYGEVAIPSSDFESRPRPASPPRPFGTKRTESRRLDRSCSASDGARSTLVEAILAVDGSSRNSSQVSSPSKESDAAVHASRTESTQLEGLGAAFSPSSSHSRRRKLVKKRRSEQQQPVPAALSALALATDGTSEQPLLDPSVFSNSSGGSTRTVSGPGPRFERPSVDPTRSERPLGDPTRPSLPLPKICMPRTRSVTTSVRSKGAAIVDEKDWVGIESFPPPIPASPAFAAPDRCRSLRHLHDRSYEAISAVPRRRLRDPHVSQNAVPSSGIGSGRRARSLGRSVSGPATENGSRVPSAAPTVEREWTSLFRRSSRKLRPEPPGPKSFSISRSGSWSRSIGRMRFSFDRHGRSSPPPVPPVPALEQLPHSAIAFLARSRRSSHRPERPPGLAGPTESNVPGLPLPSLSVPMRTDQTGSAARGSNEIERATTQSRPRRVSHRPSASLPSVPSFAMALHTSEQSVTPQTATISNNTAKRMQASEAEPPVASDSMRPNTLSDLRIPLQIAASQKRIQEDLNRVKQFAVAIEELKALRIRFDAIKSNLSAPTLCWEQAQALIDLADGVLVEEPEASAGARSPSQNDGRTHATPRSRSSSPESTASTAVRQHETLRRVFAASEVQKRASSPARAPPVPRPTLKVLTDQQSVPSLAGADLSTPKISLASSPSWRTSFRFRRLICRLRSKLAREIAVEASSLNRPTSFATSDTKTGRGAGSAKDSDGEDWDREFGFSGGVEPDELQQFDLDGKMALTSEGMPRLIAKATELRQACLRELALSQT